MTETLEKKSLIEVRKELGLTQEEFAELARCHITKLSRLECGYDSFNTMAGKRILSTLEELGVDTLTVDKKAGLRARRESIEEKGIWVEDGYRATTPRRSLKDWRLARGLSQRELGLIAQLNEHTISKAEGGIYSPAPLTRQRIARALRVKQSKIYFGGDDPPTESEVRIEDRLRADLRRAQYVLHKAYDFMRDDSNVTFKAQDTRDSLLPEIQRELKGT